MLFQAWNSRLDVKLIVPAPVYKDDAKVLTECHFVADEMAMLSRKAECKIDAERP